MFRRLVITVALCAICLASIAAAGNAHISRFHRCAGTIQSDGVQITNLAVQHVSCRLGRRVGREFNDAERRYFGFRCKVPWTASSAEPVDCERDHDRQIIRFVASWGQPGSAAAS